MRKMPKRAAKAAGIPGDSTRKPPQPPFETFKPVRSGEWGADGSGRWWLYTRWGMHPNSIEDIDPILEAVARERGTTFITTENVLRLLDAKDPAKAVATLRAPTGKDVDLSLRRRKPESAEEEPSLPMGVTLGEDEPTLTAKSRKGRR